jgi:hypothetical protein
MSTVAYRRRRSDAPEFVETRVNIDSAADDIFGRYVGDQDVVIDGVYGKATFFSRDYCPDYRVMKLAGRLALAVNQHATEDLGSPDAPASLRVTVHEIMVAALLHDLGKHHEDCAPFLTLLQQTNLRESEIDSAGRKRLLDIVRDIHCRKGPCMIDRLRDAGRPELHNPFVATTARRHGEDYQTNRTECWWAREINVITIADDYDAMTSEGPERAYKSRAIHAPDAVRLLRDGVARGRYESQLTNIFIADVLGFDESAGA